MRSATAVSIFGEPSSEPTPQSWSIIFLAVPTSAGAGRPQELAAFPHGAESGGETSRGLPGPYLLPSAHGAESGGVTSCGLPGPYLLPSAHGAEVGGVTSCGLTRPCASFCIKSSPQA